MKFEKTTMTLKVDNELVTSNNLMFSKIACKLSIWIVLPWYYNLTNQKPKTSRLEATKIQFYINSTRSKLWPLDLIFH